MTYLLFITLWEVIVDLFLHIQFYWLRIVELYAICIERISTFDLWNQKREESNQI